MWIGDIAPLFDIKDKKPGKHQHGWEGAAPASDAGCGHQRCFMRVSAASKFLVFFGFDPIRLDSRWLGFDSSRTGLIWPESGCIGLRPKLTETAKIARAQSHMAPPSFADLHLGFFLGKKLEHHHSHSGFLLHPLSLCWSALLFIFSSFLYFFIQSASGLFVQIRFSLQSALSPTRGGVALQVVF